MLLDVVGRYLPARTCEPGACSIPLGGTPNARVRQIVISCSFSEAS